MCSFEIVNDCTDEKREKAEKFRKTVLPRKDINCWRMSLGRDPVER
jgi:hypothetical protein